MLYIHQSNHLERLAIQFATMLQTSLKDTFDAEIVVVQNAGMARWLALNTANLAGISANMQAMFPAEFMWQLLRDVLPGLSKQDPCAPAVLRWRLLEILQQQRADFPELNDYFSGSDSGSGEEIASAEGRDKNQQILAWDLACELSRVLDQYLFYRDDWIRDWQSEDSDTTGANNNWQARLWNRAVTDHHLTHWLSLQDQFSTMLSDSSDKLSGKLPERVSFFSLSALSPGYLRLLGELGKKTQVHVFVINPCQEFWGDIESEKTIAKLMPEEDEYYQSGNPLLSSMGKQGRNFIDQILDLPDIVELNDWQEPADSGKQEKSLLQHIQSDILHLRHAKKPANDSDLDIDNDHFLSADSTIGFHACHTPMREVEVLHDQLLDLLQTHSNTLTPADMVVMVPDIDQYAPYIEAVFATSEYKLPFTIADRNAASSYQEIEALVKILDIADTRFDVESVFELLDYAPIRSHFNLQASDVMQCRELARATNIRWGISETKRVRENLPESAEHTWRYALDRMLLGYCMPGEKLFAEPSRPGLPLLPYNEIEGSQAQILANFIEFTRVLFELNDSSNEEFPLQQWLSRIRSLLQNLFAEDSELVAIFNLLDKLESQAKLADFIETDCEIDDGDSENITKVKSTVDKSIADNKSDANMLTYQLLRKIIKQGLKEISGTENFLGQGITFCALVPMRSVPFKVVALLGMNDGEFPRQDKHPSFDLMAKNPRRGDRSRREEDRFLFLESILAARQQLLISYVGQNVKDNKALPPSVLVSELLDTLCEYTGQGENYWVLKHPLQAFSPQYFNQTNSTHNQQHPKLFSYVKAYAELDSPHIRPGDQRKPQVFIKEPLEQLDESFKHINLIDFMRFYQSPAREFLNRRFSIQTYNKETLLPIREPFQLEPFVDREIRQQLLNQWLTTNESVSEQESDLEAQMEAEAENNLVAETYQDALLISRAKGVLPYGDIGDELFNREKSIINAFKQAIPDISDTRNLPFSLQVGAFSLSGELHQLSPAGRIVIQPGKPNFRDIIQLFIQHIILNIKSNDLPDLNRDDNSESGNSYFYSPEQSFKIAPVDNATQRLEILLDCYWQGLHFPSRFFPRPAVKMYQKSLEGSQMEPKVSDALNAWEGGYFQASEKDKFENWLLYRTYVSQELFDDTFMQVSEQLLGGYQIDMIA